MPIAVQWWAVWYPGAEPGGGSYVAQRMLASKTEKDALAAVLFFNVAHYVLRPWPWILVGLASLIVYPTLDDLARAVPHVAPGLVGHDLAYPVMLRFLPVGFAGLMVGGLVAANSSTILTHLNWGASYLVHDLYRRFLNTDRERGALRPRPAASRRSALFVLSSAMVYALDTAKSAFDIILQVGAGTGLLYLARWFWWRVNAWCEVVAMVSSLAVSVVLLILARQGMGLSSHRALVVTVIATTACWVATAYLGPQTDPEVLRVLLPEGAARRPRLGAGPRAARPRRPTPPSAIRCRWRWSAGRSAARWCGRRCSRSARRSTAHGAWPAGLAATAARQRHRPGVCCRAACGRRRSGDVAPVPGAPPR